MLRLLVLALLIANLGFFAWTEGWLDRWAGTPGRGEREPERLARQVRPETVRVIPPGAPMPASPPASAAARPLACLESAPLTAAQATALGAALKRLFPPLPEGSWVDDASEPAPSWWVYMGRYAGREALARKEDELRRRHLDFEVVEVPASLAPGLSLGRYADKAAADEALAGLAQQGIHTARVVQALAAGAPQHVLRFARADARVAAQVAALRGDVYGAGFGECGSGAAAPAPAPAPGDAASASR